MKPQEKAKELINQYEEVAGQSKECALICVNEILKLTPIDGVLSLCDYSYINFKYWQEVKQEIEKL